MYHKDFQSRIFQIEVTDALCIPVSAVAVAFLAERIEKSTVIVDRGRTIDHFLTTVSIHIRRCKGMRALSVERCTLLII